MVPRLLLLACLLAPLPAPLPGEEAPLPYPAEVEDPFGLGERLALIDHLREQLGLQPPTGASREELLALYWQQQGADALARARGETPPSELAAEQEAAERRSERIWQLRMALRDYHDVEAPADADEATLQALLQRARQAQAADPGDDSPPQPPAEPPAQVAAVGVLPIGVSRPSSGGGSGSGGELARWRSTIDACWEQFRQSSEPFTAVWPGDILPAERKAWRIERADGSLEILDAQPPGPDGIARYWWARQSNGRAPSVYVWQPAAWDPHRREWLTTPLEYARLEPAVDHWRTLLNAIVKHPQLEGSPARGWMELHKAELRDRLESRDAGASAAAVDQALAAASQALGFDLHPSQDLAVEYFLALSDWRRYAAQLQPLQTANQRASTESERQGWIQRVQRCQELLARQRALLERLLQSLPE